MVKRQEPERLFQESLVQKLVREQRVPFNHIYYPRSPIEGKRAKLMGLQSGWPDLIFPAPKTFGLELKAPGGRQSLLQKSIEREWEQFGLVYHVASSHDEAMELIQQHCPWGYDTMMGTNHHKGPVIYAGDPDWYGVTVGLCRELHDWLTKEAERRNLSRSEMARLMIIEAYGREHHTWR